LPSTLKNLYVCSSDENIHILLDIPETIQNVCYIYNEIHGYTAINNLPNCVTEVIVDFIYQDETDILTNLPSFIKTIRIICDPDEVIKRITKIPYGCVITEF